MEINAIDYRVLKILRKTHTNIDIERLAKKSNTTANRIYKLIRSGHISSGKEPITFLSADTPASPVTPHITEKGIDAVDDYEAERLDRLSWLLRDKALNITVSIITAFITSVLTYFIIPYVEAFFSRM